MNKQMASEQTDGGEPAGEPVLVWDGECGFCRRSVDYLRERVPADRLTFQPYQEFDERPDELGDDDFARAVHLVRPDGSWTRGAEAIFDALQLAPSGGLGRWLYLNLPGFAAVTERIYRWVAEHRGFVDRWTRRLIGADLGPSGFRFARRAFVRLVGLVFLIAFVSFGLQGMGLLGSEGILPAETHWSYLTDRSDGGVFDHPSIFWLFAPTDAVLQGVWITGGAASLALVIGWLPLPLLVICWLLYLSLVTVGGPFFSLQWDALLLESALVAGLMAPRCRRLGGDAGDSRVPRAALFLAWWLAFRLVWMSGVVKLLSGDPVWRNLTALEYHFWTQPLPTWTAYYAAGLPEVVLSAATFVMFVIELLVPLLIFGPRRVRHAAAAGFALLQVGILATGNYGFFNLLALALCVPLVDDRAWRSLFGRWMQISVGEGMVSRPRWCSMGIAVVAVGIIGLSTVKMGVKFSMMGIESRPIPKVVRVASSWSGLLDGFRTINNYGLFADMTTERPELIVEGSNDGETWRRYDFRWKPDAPDDHPSYAVPHMPRLDWRLWFAALRGCDHPGWYSYLLHALLEGRADALTLLNTAPFDEPPTYLRTRLTKFRFADGEGDLEPEQDMSNWWRTVGDSQVCSVVKLKDGRLQPVYRPTVR